MRLVFLLLADSAEPTEQGKINIEGAGIHAVLAPGFPVLLNRLVAVCKAEGQVTELGEHVITVLLMGPDGELVAGQIDQPFVLARDPLIPYRPVEHVRIIELEPVELRRPGDYAVHVLVDGFDLGSEPLYARERRA